MPNRTQKMRRALMRVNTRLLLSAVMLLQFAALSLAAFRGETVSVQTLIFAFAVPIATMAVTLLTSKLWPVDRAILILVLFLLSIGVITLSAIAKSESTPRTHAIYVLAGLGAMLFGAQFIRSWKTWKKYAPYLAVLCLIALATPYLPKIGVYKNGARNWIQIIPEKLTIQPSEFMKPVLIVVLASGFSNRPRFVKCLPTIAFAALCCAMR